MTKSKDEVRNEIISLINQGVELLLNEKQKNSKTGQKKSENPEDSEELPLLFVRYQEWYTKALPVVRQLLPDRYSEFLEQYKNEKRKEITYLTYTISDYLVGIRITQSTKEVVDAKIAFIAKFQHQLAILRSAMIRIDSLLSDIKAILQSELFDDELSVARELLTKGHLRAAGAVAGVTVERHLNQVAVAHAIALRKADPTIADLNESLKTAGIVDIPDWRFIQRIADIRNLCVHSKGREPTKDEVDELIRGADKLIKTLS